MKILKSPSTGAAPLDPAYFWIEDSSRNRFTVNGIQRDFLEGIFPGGFYPDTILNIYLL